MEGTLAEIRLFAGTFAPRAWAFCAGQLIAISSNQALFSLLGTTYGGDGRTSFALPDLRGRTAVGWDGGAGPGLTPRPLGSQTGTETVILTVNQIPSHTHTVQCNGTADSGNSNTPANHFPAVGQTSGSGPGAQAVNTNWAPTSNTQMNANMINNTGGSQSHNNMQPSLGLNYIICMFGVYPSRN